MAASEGSSVFVWLVVVLGGLVAVVLGGLVYVPPYFANREVKTAVESGLANADATQSDDVLIQNINRFIMDAKTSRYWVEDNKQQQAVDFQLTSDMITFSRDDDRHVSADVDYTQTMWMPLVGKPKELHYRFHVSPKSN